MWYHTSASASVFKEGETGETTLLIGTIALSMIGTYFALVSAATEQRTTATINRCRWLTVLDIFLINTDVLLLAGMDNQLNQVDCLHRKRLLALVNHFVAQTVHFLSKFGSDCEGRLLQAEAKIQKIDADLRLLEAKLSHVETLTASRGEANTEESQVGPKRHATTARAGQLSKPICSRGPSSHS